MEVSGIYYRMRQVLEMSGEDEAIRRLTVWRQGPSLRELDLFAQRYQVSLDWLATGRGGFNPATLRAPRP
jgi:hypothetical protein